MKNKEDKGLPIGRIDVFSFKNEKNDERSPISIDLLPLKEFVVFKLHTNNFDQFKEIVSFFMKKSNGQQMTMPIVLMSYLFAQNEHKDTNVLINTGNGYKEMPHSLIIPFDIKEWIDDECEEALFRLYLKPDTELYIEFFE